MSSVSPPELSPTVDCDVHVTVPSITALVPHLSEQWSEYVRWTGFKPPGGFALNYPSWMPWFEATAAKDPLAAITGTVLAEVDRAILQCYFGLDGIGNPFLADALAGAVNAWLVDLLAQDTRLLAIATITPQHTPQAVAQIECVAANDRFVGVLVPARSPEPYGNQRYWPIWEAADEHGLVVVLSYGGVPAVRHTPDFFADYVLAAQAFQTQISSLVMCGVFNRWPNLRVTVCESGWTWLPSLFWRMDQEWKAYSGEVPWLREPPSAYVRRHFRFTTQPIDASDPVALNELLQQIGGESHTGHQLLLHGSDHPHRYNTVDDPLEACLSPAERDQVRRGNPRQWYRRGMLSA
jgi:uncharacterized protein